MKKFIALLTTLIFLVSIVPFGVMAESTPIEILKMDFNHPVKGQIAAATFSAYSTEAPLTKASVENSAMKVEMESDWSDDNGVKTNVTDAVKNAISSGDIIEVSYSVQTWAWQGDSAVNQAKAFLQIGDNIVQLASGPDDAADGDACTLTGSSVVEFGADDTIYLCFTHGASIQIYDDIILNGYKNDKPGSGDDTPGDDTPGDETEWEVIYSEEFVSEGTREETEWVSMSDKSTIVEKEWGVLVGDDDGASLDITDLVSGGMQLKVETAFGVNTDDQKIKAFISTIKGGVEEICNDAESEFSIDPELVNDSWGGSTLYNPVAFTATLPDRVSASTSVYLNLSFPSGYYKMDFVKIYVNPDSVGSGGEENFISLKSSQSATGSFFPSTAKAVMLHDFGSAEGAQQLALYTAYKTEFSKDPVLSSGAAQFSFSSDWSADNGVSLDLTDLFHTSVPQDTPVRVSFSIKASYWGSNPGDSTADATLNISGNSYKVISYAPPETTTSITYNVSGVCTQPVSQSDTVTLNITQKSGSFTIDNVKIEVPYDTAKVYDIAVPSENDLPDFVYVSYGDSEEQYEVDVKWEDYDYKPVMYGVVSGMDNVKAKAIITSIAVMISEQDGVCSTNMVPVGTDADYDKDKSIVVDNITDWNIISSFNGEVIVADKSTANAPISISDNNDGSITVEGSLGEENAAKDVLVAICKGDYPVWFNQVATATDGTYKISLPLSETGSLTAYVGNLYDGTSKKYTFAYASSLDFNDLKEKIAQTDDLSTLFETGADAQSNVDILGATIFDTFVGLNSGDKTAIYTMLKNSIGDMNRAEAAALVDGNTAIAKINEDATAVELLTLLGAAETYLDIKDVDVYSRIKKFDADELTDLLARVREEGKKTAKDFKDVLLGSGMSVAIKSAQYYTDVISILNKNNALFTPYKVDAYNVSTTVAKQLMTTGDDCSNLKDLAKAVSDAKAAASAPVGGGGGGGGGGGTPPAKQETTTVFTDVPHKQVEEIPDPPVDDGKNFTDLTEEVVWAIDSINNLAEAGVLNGFEDRTFRPGNLVTREEFVSMLAKALNAQGSYTSNFWDVPESKWSYQAVSFAYATGIVKGMEDNYFGAGEAITRQDLAVMAYMALWQCGKIPPRGELAFADGNSIADYAKDAVASLCKAGIINGKGNNRFAPGDCATRAEAAVILERIIQYK